MTEPVVIGFGGNVGTEGQIIERFGRAREALAVLGPARSAPLYRSAPLGPAQPSFLNTAILLTVAELQPSELLAIVLEVERLLGRRRTHEARWGPRTIDLDVLLWGTRVVRTPELEVPHPRLAERRFALAPLIALLGEAIEIPGAGRGGELLRNVITQDVTEISPHW